MANAYGIGDKNGNFRLGTEESLADARAYTGKKGEFLFRVEGDVLTALRKWDGEQWVKLKDVFTITPAPSKHEEVDAQSPPVSNDVELAFFEAGLRIDKDALDDALIEQADLMGKVSSRRALALSLRDEAKDRVKQVEGELYTEIKGEIERTDNKRPTDKGIEARINSHPRRVKAVDRHVKAIRESMEWEGMFESYKSRGFALGELNSLYIAGYFTVSSARANVNEVKQRQGEEAKRAREEAYASRRKDRAKDA